MMLSESMLCLMTTTYFAFFFFFKQKTAYEMRISDWSSDVCSSDLPGVLGRRRAHRFRRAIGPLRDRRLCQEPHRQPQVDGHPDRSLDAHQILYRSLSAPLRCRADGEVPVSEAANQEELFRLPTRGGHAPLARRWPVGAPPRARLIVARGR